MSAWTAAMGALMPAWALVFWIGWRGRIGQRFAAYQLAGGIAVILLVLFTFASDQPSLTDLALTLVLLQLPGTLLLAVFVERWL